MELDVRLLEMPDKIKAQQLHCADLAQATEAQRTLVEKMKKVHLDTVLSAMQEDKPKYSNDKQRAIALDKLLAEDECYTKSLQILLDIEKSQKLAGIELDYQHNVFKALLAIAGMGR